MRMALSPGRRLLLLGASLLIVLAYVGFALTDYLAARFSERTVLKRIPEEIGTRQISRTASGAEIDLLIATIPAFPNLPIQCDCHFASPNAKYCVGREMTFIRGKIPLKLVTGW